MRATNKDIPHINYILSQDDVFQYCIDDNFPMEHRWRLGRLLTDIPNSYISLPNPHCVFIALPTSNSIIYEVHVAVSPEGRGKEAVLAARDSISDFFNNMEGVHKLIGFTPTSLKRALMFARMVGFTKEGICKDSFLKDGELHDLVISGYSRKEVRV